MEDRHRVKEEPAANSNATSPPRLPWLETTDAASPMAAPNMDTAAQHEGEDEDYDQGKNEDDQLQAQAAAGQSSAHNDKQGADASDSLDGGQAQWVITRDGPRMLTRWVSSSYRLPPYHRTDLCSVASLGIANSIMQACTLPGLELGSFLLLSDTSLLFRLGISWGFTAMTLALGSSYFQRLCHVVPSLAWAAQRHAGFAAYAAPRLPDSDDDLGLGYVNSPAYQSRELTLRSVMFTCVSIASKNVDRSPHPGILQFMLSKIYGVPVTAEHVYDLEQKCLDGLGWRLGPHFVHDILDNNWVAWIMS